MAEEDFNEVRELATDIIKGIAKMDTEDELGIKFGGDGDIGETMIDLLEKFMLEESKE